MQKASASASTGQAFASSDWLINHYLSKSPQVLRYVASLPIFPGDRVLDLGCGIGFYMEYFLRMVGTAGKVVGLDHDPELTSIARENLQRGFFDNWEIVNSDIFQFAKNFKYFNKIILFNCLSYQENLKSTIEHLYQNLSAGSLLIIKDFDMTTSVYNPIDKRLHGELIEAVRKELIVRPTGKINKFVGGALHGISNEISGAKSCSSIWSYINTHPFSRQQIQFMRETHANSVEMAHGHCSDEVIRYISSQFIDEDAFFYEAQASSFVENEHLVILPA
ncbi:methyltransferase domain-containing protein [Breoghania sp. L-A4]|uniref:class I SAM-dependent methyltransferase n=1 Tax=Breoghania sp. L-A4 TaxID=2304600 RepID=UPI0013C2F4BE|nr:methyltransferase domain-containing protein [Breoghania sp. L-A4]